ncbi:hypothetical protein K504DRAFT_498278 [Pleomassaria siparia CBS 279.74]|uniref:Uncharacterized protein n=1 Tax=Pleomassaria siparia CBS 279.74 TaxID=1314801 RepID=A0A6G1KM83_9PLEO|nr:hypothetical protein K504DRAFT_498278 [Pleomassaria siparia CBS 279.74]
MRLIIPLLTWHSLRSQRRPTLCLRPPSRVFFLFEEFGQCPHHLGYLRLVLGEALGEYVNVLIRILIKPVTPTTARKVREKRVLGASHEGQKNINFERSSSHKSSHNCCSCIVFLRVQGNSDEVG